MQLKFQIVNLPLEFYRKVLHLDIQVWFTITKLAYQVIEGIISKNLEELDYVWMINFL